jgi:hypothetical protein
LYLTDAYAAGYPSAANVRSGTTYGAGGSLTGTCAVPGAASVVVGVAVDNTTGTAAVTAATIRAAVGLASANLDTQLAALPTSSAPTAAAIRTEMDANSTKLANLDATISSRSTYAGGDTSGTTTLLGRLTSTRAGYLDNLSSAAPSAATIASTVWAAATRTLTTTIPSASDVATAVWAVGTSALSSAGTIGKLLVDNINATISSRSTYDGSDTSGTTTLLGRLTSGRASGLDNLDAAVSSRLAASGYTAPPSAATNASAVRTELSIELGRIDAAISSRLAPDGTLTTVTNLTNAPDVPTPEEIAAEVWTTTVREVTGGTVDNVTNSTPVDATEIAEAVRTELTPELARVANAATTQEVGDIVEGALALPET